MVRYMSVLKSKRKPGRLQVLTKAAELARYTIEITSNEKNFPKRHRWQLTQRILDDAMGIYCCIRMANSVRPVQITLEDDFRYRLAQQRAAHAHVESLLGLMEIAYEVFSIDGGRIEHWTGLVVEVDRLLLAWRKSDRENFKRMSAADKGA